MKYLIGILAIVGTIQLCQVNALVILSEFERYYTVCTSNSVISSPNKSEPSQTIEFLQSIVPDTPILLSATISNFNTKAVLHKSNSVDICKDQTGKPWDAIVVEIFYRGMLPRGYKDRPCPVWPQEHTIHRFEKFYVKTQISLPAAKYDITYMVKSSENELIFPRVSFKFDGR